MAINPLGGAGPANVSGAGSPNKTESFSKVLKGQSLENAPMPVVDAPRNVNVAQPGKCRVESAKATVSAEAQQSSAARVIDSVTQAQNRMEEILKVAESGKSFSPAELLSLQTHVYRASQELDLAGKVVEKATGGIKQVLQTQV